MSHEEVRSKTLRKLRDELQLDTCTNVKYSESYEGNLRTMASVMPDVKPAGIVSVVRGRKTTIFTPSDIGIVDGVTARRITGVEVGADGQTVRLDVFGTDQEGKDRTVQIKAGGDVDYRFKLIRNN